MKLTDEQKNQLTTALQLIDNVHHDVSKNQGPNSEELEAVNEAWCVLDNVIKKSE